MPLGGLTVLFGPNGAGKTNVIEALGAHDPLARRSLERVGGQRSEDRARVGLVARFNVDVEGSGPDAGRLLEMLAAPWAEGIAPLDITDGIGAYCGSCWWLDGGDLYDEADRASLTEAYAVIRGSLIAGADPDQRERAGRLLDLLLGDPMFIVQEDFAVELTFDRATPRGSEIVGLADGLRVSGDNVLSHLLGPLRSWTGRWPPLTTMSRGPGAEPADPDIEPVTPAGFDWVVSQLGGVRVVSGDLHVIEAGLDKSLEEVHDALWHRPFDEGWGAEDQLCATCFGSDHGGKVDADEPVSPAAPPRPAWLESRDGWSRVRPSLASAFSVIEDEANRQLPGFVSEQGQVRLRIAEPERWAERNSRCEFLSEVVPGEVGPEPADWDGPVGVLGFTGLPQPSTKTIAAVDLGAGMRRWVATAVRLAVDACKSGELTVVLRGDIDPDVTDEEATDLELVVRSGAVRPQMLLIDEPEQHLHPHAQHVIAGWAADQARHHQAVVVATHSPAFFSLPPERAQHCEVRRVGHSTRIRPLRRVHGPEAVEQARSLGFDLGLGRDALAQLTRAVVVVEGDWDRRLLHHYFGDELADQRLLVVVLQGSDELGGLADAAVIPALGVPVIALLDEVRATTATDLDALPDPLTKSERALRDLARELGDDLRIVRYEDPDVICALPESAVRAAYPDADFPGWDALLLEWSEACTGSDWVPFKKWVLKRMGLGKRDRFAARFFRCVLASDHEGQPMPRFRHAAMQVLALST